MTSNLFITDQRMLQVMVWAISGKEKDVATEKAFCEQIGFNFRNLPKVKTGAVSFTKEHLLRCAQVFGTDMNWLFGLSSTMLRTGQPTAIHQIKNVMQSMHQQVDSLEKEALQNIQKRYSHFENPRPATISAAFEDNKTANKKAIKKAVRSTK